MTRMEWAALALAVSAVPGAAAGQNKDAALFGARENIEQISLSPDGTHAAMIMPLAGRGAAVFIVDLVAGTSPKPILRGSGDPERLTGCSWSTDTRLVCSMYTIQRDRDIVGYTRLLSINRDGSDMKALSARTSDRALGVAQDGGTVIDWTGDGQPGSVLATRRFVPEQTTGSLSASTREGLGVERIDTTTLKRSTIVPPRGTAVEYLTDGRGAVRIMGTLPKMTDQTIGDTVSYTYLKRSSRDWLPLSTVVQTPTGSSGFDPYAVDPALDVAYGFDAANGRSGLYRIALDGTLKRELVVSRSDVDIDELLRIGRQRRVVGVSYVTERRESEFFDPELKKLGLSLAKALPGQPLVRFVDASADESKLLLFAGSDKDPGTYYLFDKTTRG